MTTILPSLADDPCQVRGEGITRTSDPRATLWPFRVRAGIGQPMTGTIRAIDRHQARRFLMARYPKAIEARILTRAEAGR